jgi:hypothetical protein
VLFQMTSGGGASSEQWNQIRSVLTTQAVESSTNSVIYAISTLFPGRYSRPDVLALVAFIDWLFEKRHVQARAGSTYLSGVKDYFSSSALRLSPALGPRGALHPLVSRALRSLQHAPEAIPPTQRQPFTEAMLIRGRQLWPPALYAMVVICRGFLLRTGELWPEGDRFGSHALTWADIEFWDAQQQILPVAQWTSTLASYARIVHQSRKWQNLVVRETPARTRLFFPESGSVVDGLLSPQAKGCVVATLQAYYVYSGARTCPADSYLARQWDGTYITAEEARDAIHQVSKEFVFADKEVCIHSLKHWATSALTDAHMSDEEGRMAAGFKDAATLCI